MQDLRVIIAGGGTGGHIFPAVAIGHALKRFVPRTKLLFVGAKNKMEMEKIPQEGFDIIGLDIAGFNRSNLLSNVSLPIKLIKTRIESNKIISDFKPNVVVGVGGYASFPVLSAAQSKNIPTVIQEQNSYAGKSNQILAKKATTICVAYKNMETFFPKEKLLLTGNPVRKNISMPSIPSSVAKMKFGLNENKLTILVIGGSLGAKSINEAIAFNLDKILSENVQLIWQTGKGFFPKAQEHAQPHRGKVQVVEFIKDMDIAYAATDIIVSRAGALAISEICIAAKPVVFVPYPFAAEDHQTANAKALVEQNAAILIADSDAIKELFDKIKFLIDNAGIRESMSMNLKSLAITDADEKIAKKIIEIAETK